MTGRLWWLIGVVACAPAPADDTVALPARFEADRIFVDVPVRGGDTLHLYTDTGGGLFILRDAADRVHWSDSTGVTLPRLALDSAFPEPLGSPDRRVPIFRPEGAMTLEFDGMLGQAWFAGRTWTIDYAARKLFVHRAEAKPPAGSQVVPLGFKTDSAGVRALSFPRITAVVDQDTLDWLFDTGATGHLTAAAAQLLGNVGSPIRATSFVTTSVLTRWRGRHPEWRVIQNADSTVPGMAMIEVPQVSIGSLTAGPVWFTERPDRNFHEYMSQWMDRRVDGALGGNLLRFFRVTIDYPAARAYFAR